MHNTDAVTALTKAIKEKEEREKQLLDAVANNSADTENIIAILKDGANTTARDSQGRTPLHLAVINNSAETIAALIEAGANVNVYDNNNQLQTPLHIAAENNVIETIATLIKAGAIIDINDKKGRTPLHIAAGNNAVEAIVALIKAGANVDAGIGNNTPLHIAAKNNAVETIVALTKAGANVDAGIGDNTLLHFAAENNAAKAIVVLIKAGLHVDVKDIQGNTPLHLASGKESIDILIKAGANMSAKDKNGHTPLYHAVRRDAVESVVTLIKAGCEVRINPEFLASVISSKKCLALFIEPYRAILERRGELAQGQSFLDSLLIRFIPMTAAYRNDQELKALNNELRPIFGQVMENRILFDPRCGGIARDKPVHPGGCGKLGYGFPAGSRLSRSYTTKEKYTPTQTLRNKTGQVIGTIEGKSEMRDVQHTDSWQPMVCLNCNHRWNQ